MPQGMESQAEGETVDASTAGAVRPASSPHSSNSPAAAPPPLLLPQRCRATRQQRMGALPGAWRQPKARQ
eukprot:1503647-Pyramimonas_sp.AAC.1